MAERRMFAKTITESDAFLDMPSSTQNLYFHLNMSADDDGFVNNPKKVQRMIGASDDDLKILCAKSFLIPFDSGVVVIKHWRISNYLRSDRYKATVYQDEYKQLDVKENKAYTKNVSGIPMVAEPVDTRETQVSIGKDRLGKDSIDNTPDKPVKHKYGEFSHVLLTDSEAQNLFDEWGQDEFFRMVKILDEGIETKGYKYKNCNLALRKWKANEKGFVKPYSKPIKDLSNGYILPEGMDELPGEMR